MAKSAFAGEMRTKVTIQREDAVTRPNGYTEMAWESIFPGLPAEVVGIQRDAVTPQAGAGIERLEAVGLRFRCIDHLPDVDAHSVAQDR